MKLLRYRIGFALLLLLFSGALGQNLSAWQVTTLQNAATATGNGTTMPSSAMGAVSVQITGTFSATVTFEGTMDGSTWVALMATNANDDARATTATAAGVYSVVLNGCTSFRARISSYSSGTVTVKARLGNGVISRTSSGGGGLTVGATAIASGAAGRLLYEASGNVLGEVSTLTSDGSVLTMTRAGIGTTSTDGIVLTNSTAAAAGAQQWSPRLRLTAQGWKTNSTAASQTVDWAIENQPVQGATAPTTNLVFRPQINGAGYLTSTSAVTITSDSYLLVPGGIITLDNRLISAGGGTRIVSISDNVGFWLNSSYPKFKFSNSQGAFTLGLGNSIIFSSDTDLTPTSNTVQTQLRSSATGHLVHGAADVDTSVVSQIDSVQNALAGGTSNVAGADRYFDGSRGKGSGAGGAHIWRVAPAGSSGTAQNALVERMRLDENGLKFTEVSSTTTPSSNTISVYAKDKSGTSALYLKNDAGTETEIGAASSPYTAPPAVADWTWVNQGSATGTDTTSGIDLYAPNGSGDNLRILARAVPSTPYTITAAISITMFADNYAAAGFCWRESGTGEVAYVGLTHATTYTLGFNKYASLTSYDSTYFNNAFAPGDVLWIKASDDGTNRTVSISRTGTSWLQIATHTRTDFLTPDQVGFFANSNQSTVTTGVLATLRSWSVQ